MTEGEILLNGVNIKQYNKHSYYKIFSPAFQEVELFAFPLYMNVSMSSADKSDKEKARQCVIDSGLENKLSELEKGMDTEILKIVYDDGVDLSGGEKQRLSIARAVLKNPSVLVFDEATAAVDSETENLIQEAIERLISGRTTLMIAHRLSTLRKANKIIVVDQGKIIECGSHEELMALNGKYRRLIEIQAMGNHEPGLTVPN